MRNCLKKQDKQCINQRKDAHVHSSPDPLSSLLSCFGLVLQQRPVLITGVPSVGIRHSPSGLRLDGSGCLPEPTWAQGDKLDGTGTSLQPCWTPKLGVQTQTIQVHCKGHSSHLYMVPALLHVCFAVGLVKSLYGGKSYMGPGLRQGFSRAWEQGFRPHFPSLSRKEARPLHPSGPGKF